MESKKDIGKLFRDNLDQLDYAPSTKVWEQIELDLKEKKKKRRFFIWFFLTTLLVSSLLIGIGYTFSDGNSFMNKEVNNTSDSNEKTNGNTKTVIAEDENSKGLNSEKEIENENKNSNSSKIESQNSKTGLTTNSEKSKTASKSNLKIGSKNQWNQNSSIANTTVKNKKGKKNKSGNSLVWNKNSSREDNKNNQQSIAEQQKVRSKEVTLDSQGKVNTTNNGSSESLEKRSSIDSLIAATTNKKTPRKDKKEKDSLAVKDSITEDKEKPTEYEIVVAPYYGINYGGYFGEFDALSNNTILKNESGMRNTYGVLVRWMFGNKLGLQIGAGKMNNRYFSTIEKNGDAFINTQNVDTNRPIAEINGIFVNETKVKFTYDSSFIEVPLEAYYVLRDKKFGFATSIGVSMLFGGKNTVFAESENIPKMEIGTLTTNLPTSATANAKLYLFYKITPSLHLDLYPSFQYQIMGNSDKSNYSGYFFSVRTGLSYKL